MDFQSLKKNYTDLGCKRLYIKELSPNDNSKNQVYLGGSFDVLNVFPLSEITSEEAGDWKKERFKAKLKFSWLTSDGSLSKAPKAQLILYPKYPEVRFSGFLSGSKNAPSNLMSQRLSGRQLIFGVSRSGRVVGYVVDADSIISNQIKSMNSLEVNGIFRVVDLSGAFDTKQELIKEIRRIHHLGWIDSKRLNNKSEILPCKSSNCGGYTLEAELGITPNGYSEPDYLGWEIKQFGVKRFDRINSSVITLMTPEPNGGLYKSKGIEYFIYNYGYKDKLGRPDRMNFGGVHKANVRHSSTELKLELIGFDSESGKIRNSAGRIALIDKDGIEAASWDFSSLLKHWVRKHNQACYIPSILKKENGQKYSYGNNLILGIGTDFQFFLNEMNQGNIYYDPGIKMENISTKPKIKRRSQFRVKSGNLINLYADHELFDLNTS